MQSHIRVTDSTGKSKQYKANEWFWAGKRNPEQEDSTVPGLEV